MRIHYSHRWPRTKQQAYSHLETAALNVLTEGAISEAGTLAVVSSSFGYRGRYLYAAALLMAYPSLKELGHSFAAREVVFPHHPSLLYYREGPAILAALSSLDGDPDILLLPDHGIAHPYRCGLASLVGLAFDKPSVGCCRRLLAGEHQPLDPQSGSEASIWLDGTEAGIAYRSRDSVKPIYISPGHRCSLEEAGRFSVGLLRGFRMPEPLRIAHLLANKRRRHVERKRAKKRTEQLAGA